MGRLADADLAEWRRVMDVNFHAAYLCSREALAALTDGGGSIVHLASIAAVHPNAGTRRMRRPRLLSSPSPARPLSNGVPDGIRVNAIAPGMISGTNMTAAETEDVAAVTVSLLSDAARYVTRQLLMVDGGWSVSLFSFTPRPWD